MDKKKEYDEVYYFGYFKKLFESWEESTNKFVDVWMKSPLMERAVEKSSEFKNYVHGFIEQTLEQRYLPQKKDMDILINTLDSLGEKIAELESKIKDLESSTKKSSPKTGTRITKKRVKEKKQ
ncbi:MAG: hypothetical protein ACHQ6U_01775 [Thermodesulfobacteriota bacterium]